jgi:hypothetical protein
MKLAFAVAVLALSLVACGGSKSQSSNPIGYSLMTSQSDVNTGVLTQDKGLGSVAGNPYFDFITGAKTDFGNKDPSKLEVTSVSLTLGGNSQGVTALEQVFASGEVDVLVRIDSTNQTYPVAHKTDVAGAGPVGFDIDFQSSSLSAADLSALLAGNAHLVIRGPATAAFASSSEKAELALSVVFKADE